MPEGAGHAPSYQSCDGVHHRNDASSIISFPARTRNHDGRPPVPCPSWERRCILARGSLFPPVSTLRDQLQHTLADRYALDREIGRGGMATVYLARDEKHHRNVALKVLDPELGAVLGAER